MYAVPFFMFHPVKSAGVSLFRQKRTWHTRTHQKEIHIWGPHQRRTRSRVAAYTYSPVEVGARGFTGQSLRTCFKILNLTNKEIKVALDSVSKVALRATYTLWLSRNTKTFGSWELISRPYIPPVEENWMESPAQPTETERLGMNSLWPVMPWMDTASTSSCSRVHVLPCGFQSWRLLGKVGVLTLARWCYQITPAVPSLTRNDQTNKSRKNHKMSWQLLQLEREGSRDQSAQPTTYRLNPPLIGPIMWCPKSGAAAVDLLEMTQDEAINLGLIISPNTEAVHVLKQHRCRFKPGSGDTRPWFSI